MYTHMPMESRERLKEILLARCLKVGRFRLTSGRRSNYYMDLKQATLEPEGAYLSALLILEELKNRQVAAAAIGGLSLGADPIVAAVAAVSFAHRDRFDPLPAFIVRKHPKSHGTRRYLEGFEGPEGSPVVVVDDVCTTGGSALKAILQAEAEGYRVAAVVSIVDREEGASENLGSYLYFSLFRAPELLSEPSVRRQLDELGDSS
jgi:orotate phosphoribosyltransferase